MKLDITQIKDTFQSGIDLENERVHIAAKHAGLHEDTLAAMDQNSDGVLDRAELHSLNLLLDTADADDEGIDLGYNADGKVRGDTVLWHGLAESIRDPRERILAVARTALQDPRLEEGYKGQERMLSHNTIHKGERVGDLIETRFENTYKCNLFVGDVLWRAGFEVPLTRGDGWTHISSAEAWLKSPIFKTISAEDVQPGDIVVIDDLTTRGSGGAHIEIVTEINGKDVVAIGSRWTENGVFEDADRLYEFRDATRVESGGYQVGDQEFRFLRHRDMETPQAQLRI